eukprot:8073716-Karenia_brevis.AAC.1
MITNLDKDRGYVNGAIWQMCTILKADQFSPGASDVRARGGLFTTSIRLRHDNSQGTGCLFE